MTTVAVTGAAGYVGPAVVAECVRRGFWVEAYDDFSVGSVERVNPVDVREGDVTDPVLQHKAASNADAVVHLAAIPGEAACAADRQRAYRVNAVATAGLAAECARHGTGLVVASTVAVFGPDPPVPVGPDSPADPHGVYAGTKHAAETNARDAAAGEVPVVALLPTNIYGAHPAHGGRAPKDTVVNLFARKAAAGGTLSVHEPGTQARDFVHVRDAARAFAGAAGLAAGGAEPGYSRYVVGGHEEMSVLGLAEAAVGALGGRVELVENPDPGPYRERFSVDTRATTAALGWRPELSVADHFEEVAAGGP